MLTLRSNRFNHFFKFVINNSIKTITSSNVKSSLSSSIFNNSKYENQYNKRFLTYNRGHTLMSDKSQDTITSIKTPTSLNNTPNNSYSITLIDKHGTPTESKFHKMDLLFELKIQARDLRTVDPSFPPQMPTILVRDKGILISMGAVRVIIQHNRVFLFDTHNSIMRDEILLSIRESLNQYESLPLPFEFKIFEAILDFVCRKLETEFKRMQKLIEKELSLLNQNPEHNLEDLLLYHKKGLNQFQVSVQEIIEATTTILQSDEDMALMYLTHRSSSGKRQKSHHDEIEILLETYTRQLEQMENNISQLKETLNSTEEFVNFQLDTNRNKMMRMNLMISLVTISTGLGGVMAGVFGMNLNSGVELHPYAFPLVCATISTIGIITFFSLRYYCKVKNILPYSKQNALKFGVGFRNDISFSNPLKDSVIEFDNTNNNAYLQPSISPNIFNHNNELLLKEQIKQQSNQIQSQQYRLQLQESQIQHQNLLLFSNNIINENGTINTITSDNNFDNDNNNANTIDNNNNNNNKNNNSPNYSNETNLCNPIFKLKQKRLLEQQQHPTPNLSQLWKYMNQ